MRGENQLLYALAVLGGEGDVDRLRLFGEVVDGMRGGNVFYLDGGGGGFDGGGADEVETAGAGGILQTQRAGDVIRRATCGEVAVRQVMRVRPRFGGGAAAA